MYNRDIECLLRGTDWALSVIHVLNSAFQWSYDIFPLQKFTNLTTKPELSSTLDGWEKLGALRPECLESRSRYEPATCRIQVRSFAALTDFLASSINFCQSKATAQ